MSVDVVSIVVDYVVRASLAAGVPLIHDPEDEQALRAAVRAAIEEIGEHTQDQPNEEMRSKLNEWFADRVAPTVSPDLPLDERLRSVLAVSPVQPVNASIAQTIAATTEALLTALYRYAGARGLTGLAQALEPADRATVRGNIVVNTMTGTAGIVVQAGEIHGDVHLNALPAAAATRTLPADTLAFTGRSAELDKLTAALSERREHGGVVKINAIDGMAGIGKTAFAVHAAHRLAKRFPDGQFFVHLHGHTPGQRPVDPADALATLLLNTGIAAQQIPLGIEERAALWRDRMADKQVLLLFDDAVSSTQVQPLLPATSGTLVLVTSRRRLTALPGATVVTLESLIPTEAAHLFIRLVDRPGLAQDDADVARIVELCGCLPLAITLLAGQLKHHPAWNVQTLLSGLSSAADRVQRMRAETISVAAAFDLSYRSLSDDQQLMFRRLGVHPGPEITPQAAAILNDTTPAHAHALLEDLYTHHLINEPAPGRYRFHDLIREHARGQAAADDPAANRAAVDRLLHNYVRATSVVNRLIFGHRLAPGEDHPMPPSADDPQTRKQAIGWIEAERLNLQAAVDHAAKAGRFNIVIKLAAAIHGCLQTLGHSDQALAVDEAAFNVALRIGNQREQARALKNMASALLAVSDYPKAFAAAAGALEIYQQTEDSRGEASTLNLMAVLQRHTQAYRAAAASHERALTLFGVLGDRSGEANALSHLGDLQHLTGDYPGASATLTRALRIYRELDDQSGEAGVLIDLGIVQFQTGDYPAAMASLTRSLKLNRMLDNRAAIPETLNNLGIAQYLSGDLPAAMASQTTALRLYRELGSELGEAFVLYDLGVVRGMTGDRQTAESTLQKALHIYRRLGNGLCQSETLNALGELTWAEPNQDTLARHESALNIARDIGVPLEEARALEGIGRHRFYHHSCEATTVLRQALAIYQRIGSANASRVESFLTDNSLGT